jgi:pimeloyl-ACP methyl ester carboxylesterase
MNEADIEQDIQPGARRTLRLRDARALGWCEWGPASGQLALLCPGAGMSSALGFAASALDELSMRLVAVDRPGFGASTAHAEKSLDSWCDDVSQLCAALGERQPVAVGFSQGAPFALALASRGLARAVAIVSGQDDFARPSVRQRLPPDVAAFVARIQSRDPAFLASFTSSIDARGLLELVVSTSSERDRSLYESAPFRAAYLRCLEEGIGRSPGSYVLDLVNTFSEWPFEVETIEAPVDLWYGALDSSPLHSPDFGAEISRRLPNATRHLLEGEGGSILWTCARQILSSLAALQRPT